MMEFAKGVASGIAQSKIGENVIEKVSEIKDEYIKNPKIITRVKTELQKKYGEYVFYNDFCNYIEKYSVVDNAISMFYEEAETKTSFISRHIKAFYVEYRCSAGEQALLKEAFDFIYQEAYNSVLQITPHSNLWKLQMEERITRSENKEEFEKLEKSQEEIYSCLKQVQVSVETMGLSKMIRTEPGECSDKVQAYLKRIDDMAKEDCEKCHDETVILKFKDMLADVSSELRGEETVYVDKVICSLRCHIAVRYCNIGKFNEAISNLEKIPSGTAENSKLFHYIMAIAITIAEVEERYDEASNHIEKALQIDPDYHRAFMIGKYLSVLKNHNADESLLIEYDEYFDESIKADEEKTLISEYYVYRGFICRQHEKYQDAIKCFLKAKEYGYDELVIDYNIGSTYYNWAVCHLPRNTRLFCVDANIEKLIEAKQIFGSWLSKTVQEIPVCLKLKMVGTYISCCGLLGIQHDLENIDEYLRIPELEYEVKRQMILGARNRITDSQIQQLDEEDRLYAQLEICISDNEFEKITTIVDEQKKRGCESLTKPMITTLLQACVITKNVEAYLVFRNQIGDESVLIKCLDAYIDEIKGNLNEAKTVLDQQAKTANDYACLVNILRFYARNEFDVEREQVFLRMLELKREKRIYIDDEMQFYGQAISFLCSKKSKNAEKFMYQLDMEGHPVDCELLKIKAEYYSSICDVPKLAECLTQLYEISGEYKYCYDVIVCMIKLFKYKEAFEKAEQLLNTATEENRDHKVAIYWLLSDLCLYLDNIEQSFEWAKKAHELFKENPYNENHQRYFYRGLRTNHVDEAVCDIVEYKETHPVVLSDWIKDVKVSSDSNDMGKDLIEELRRLVGDEDGEAKKRDLEFIKFYRTNVLANSLLFKRNNYRLDSIFLFSSKQKLMIATGNHRVRKMEEELIKEDIMVDAMTLIFLKRYGCLDALKLMKRVHICYSTIGVLQSYFLSDYYNAVTELLNWIKLEEEQIVLENDGYKTETKLAEIIGGDLLNCCKIAHELKIPLLTIETSLKPICSLMGEYKDLNTVNIVSFCYAKMQNNREGLNGMLYNLLSECTFISFNATTIFQKIEENNMGISKERLSRFFVCNTNCDMMSFAQVYVRVIKALSVKDLSASIEFTKLVLEDAIRIWKQGTHYRMVIDYLEDEQYEMKVKAIDVYVVSLIAAVEEIYSEIPPELKSLYDELCSKYNT